MNRQWHGFLHVLLLLGIFGARLPSGFAQTGRSAASDTVKRTMAAVLAHCHFKVDGVEAITFVPPSNDEIETIKSLGSAAIEPLSRYLDEEVDDGFSHLFAVRFLT
jgi:hypothetical protein